MKFSLTEPNLVGGHIISHFVPVNPFGQLHSPEYASHVALLEHSHFLLQSRPHRPGGQP